MVTPKTYKGIDLGYPYSFSRWTDVPAAKWPWLKEQLAQGWMLGFNPATGVPTRWSLRPEDTLGLIFWTRSPENLLADAALLAPYKVKVHMTVTGWHEVERGAPSMKEGSSWLRSLVGAFGEDNVSWRFSPVPMVDDVEDRFAYILDQAADVRIRSVYLSFLQANDRVPEVRPAQDRYQLLGRLASMGKRKNVEVRLCNEDRLLVGQSPVDNLCSAVCAPPQDFQQLGRDIPNSEGCGCILMVDPFSINESCVFGCTYCYTADQTTASHKRDTTKVKLPVLQGKP